MQCHGIALANTSLHKVFMMCFSASRAYYLLKQL
jgi:hypothetical protein